MKKILMSFSIICVYSLMFGCKAVAQTVPNDAYGEQLTYTWEVPFVGGKDGVYNDGEW